MLKIIGSLLLLAGSVVSDDLGEDHYRIFPRGQCIKPRKVAGCAGQGYDSYNADGIYVYLYTRDNRDTAEFIHNCNYTIPDNSNFRPKKLTIIIIYGFFENICNLASFRNLILELLKRGDYNVIAIDWPNIVYFKEHVPVVADRMVFLIRNIKRKYEMGPNMFYLIGHSVGGNIIGLIGSREAVYRCTAIDASAPDVNAKHQYHPSSYPPVNRTCAPLVDIIHCDVGYCLPPLGNFDPKGCNDFYVNGGHFQISAFPKAIHALLLQDFVLGVGSFIYIDFAFHEQCLQYFITSVNPGNCQYVAVECEDHKAAMLGHCPRSCNGTNCRVMGFDWDKYQTSCPSNHSTSYYLHTNIHCPYCDNSWIQTNGFPGSQTS